MAASAHRYSQSVLVSVRISRQGPKVVHYWQRQQHTVPEFAMRFRMIAQWRAATGAWSGVGRVETASLSLKHLLQSSPNRLQHKNGTNITLVVRAQLHLHALFLPWKSLPAPSSRLALAAAKACATSNTPSTTKPHVIAFNSF
jgi:hypothetical protein